MTISSKKAIAKEYVSLITSYIINVYGARDLDIRREVVLGTSVIGKKRRIDLLLVERSSNKALALECKWQDVGGTTDEKIPYALRDIESMRIPGAVVYAGNGMSRGVIHMLQASAFAAYCLPDPRSLVPLPTPRSLGTLNCATWELDHLLAVTYGWWDLLPAPVVQSGRDELSWPNLTQLLEERVRRAPKRVDRPHRRFDTLRSKKSL